MCHITAVTYRHGTVIEANFASDTTGALRVSQARNVGLKIQAELTSYMQTAIKQIRTVSSELGEGFGFANPQISYEEKKEISARFDPGLILDLPKISISGNGRVIEFRSCITVCVGGMKSKIWTRANTLGDWGRIPDDSLQQLHTFFDTACKKINSRLTKLYQRDLSDVLKDNVKLTPFGKIHVFATDCAGQNVSSRIEELCDDMRDRTRHIDAISNSELADAMRQVTNVTSITAAQDDTPTEEFKIKNNAKFYPFRGVNGAGSVFVRVTDNKNAYFTGIVNGDHDVRSVDFGGLDNDSNSVGTTADVAAFFGAAF